MRFRRRGGFRKGGRSRGRSRGRRRGRGTRPLRVGFRM